MGQGCAGSGRISRGCSGNQITPSVTVSPPTRRQQKTSSQSREVNGWVGEVEITAEELQDQTKRFSASKHKNNFPPIMLLTEDGSLNYSPGVVYRGPISSSFSSVHLSISSHLILILPHSVAGLRAFSGNQNRIRRQQNISKVKLLLSNSLSLSQSTAI